MEHHKARGDKKKKTTFLFDRTKKRLWIRGQRIHHGAVGFILALVGCVMAIHDVRDIFKWFKKGEQND